MPNVNCCVPTCISSTRRTPNLTFYPLPKEKDERQVWDNACKNRNLKKRSKWTSVCSLHFVGGFKGEFDKPTIFPWSPNWKDVIEEYNSSLKRWKSIENIKIKPLKLPADKDLPRTYKRTTRKPTTSRSTTSISKRELAHAQVRSPFL